MKLFLFVREISVVELTGYDESLQNVHTRGRDLSSTESRVRGQLSTPKLYCACTRDHVYRKSYIIVMTGRCINKSQACYKKG